MYQCGVAFAPQQGPEFSRELVRQARTFESPESPFNQYPVNRFGRWQWVKDEHFEIDYHLRHSSLPHPGRVRELLELVSRLHGSLQDRTRPLWDLNVIEGLNDGRMATYMRLHHSMFDGVGAMHCIVGAHSDDPEARDMPPVWAQPRRPRPQHVAASKEPIASLLDSLKSGRESVTGIARGLWDIVRKSGLDPAT